MISQGNFKELRSILDRLAKYKAPQKKKKGKNNKVEEDSGEEDEEGENENFDVYEHWEKVGETKTLSVPRQTIICSATLTTSKFIKDFESGLKLKGDEGSFEGLLSCVQFQRSGKVIDTTTAQLTAAALSEARIFCLTEEKVLFSS